MKSTNTDQKGYLVIKKISLQPCRLNAGLILHSSLSAGLVYRVSSNTILATQRSPVSKNQVPKDLMSSSGLCRYCAQVLSEARREHQILLQLKLQTPTSHLMVSDDLKLRSLERVVWIVNYKVISTVSWDAP